MAITTALALDEGSARAKRLKSIDPLDFQWAIPFMRAGYAGRTLVYVVVAGFSLWSISRGGQAEGTQDVISSLTGNGWPILILIAIGMAACGIWRLIDSVADLEAYGTDGKGMIARSGMIITALIHLGIGVLAVTALIGSSSGGGSTGVLTSVMQMQGGRWAVGLAGALTMCAAVYFFNKGWTKDYQSHLRANRFTTRWNTVLTIGVIAQGFVVGIIGGLVVFAAVQSDPNAAGGIGAAFQWLRDQAYGRFLVTALCLGLLAFAVFCAVNAAYRIVPKAYTGSGKTLAAKA